MHNNQKHTLRYAGQQVIKVATPVVGARVVLMINNFVAMLLIARLGHTQLAAGALVTTLSTMFIVGGMAVLYSVGVVTGHAFGAEDRLAIGRIVRSGWLLAVAVSIPIVIIMYNIGAILLFFHQEPHLVALVRQYFHGLAWVMTPLLLTVVCSQFLIAVNKAKVIFFWNLLRPILMLVPGYGLLYGKWGLPNMGMAGMAYAEAFMAWVMLAIGLLYIMREKEFVAYHIFAFRQGCGYVKKLFQVGWPISVQYSAELATFAASAIFMGWIGEHALAAMQIVIQLNMIVIMIPLGLTQASGILVGQAVGRKEIPFTRTLSNASLGLGLSATLFVGILYVLFPRFLAHFYINVHNPANSDTVHLASMLLLIAAVSIHFDGMRNIITGVLRGFHDTKVPMWVGICVVGLIGCPLSYVLAFVYHWGAVGIPFGYTVAYVLGSGLLLHRFYARKFCRNSRSGYSSF